jgi:hypothetical protein
MNATVAVQTLYNVRQSLRVMKENYHMSWREIALENICKGVSIGSLCRIYHGFEPGNKIRKQLGIVELLPAEACVKCGKVHTKNTCPDAPKRAHKYHYVTIDGHDYRVTKAVKEYIDQLEGASK